ncbi:MAG: hypothetical protein U0326_23795 [Polyangiales bacterium]
MHVAAFELAHALDAARRREHVVVERALEAAGLALGGAEIDHVGAHARGAEREHRAQALFDVIDLAGDHERRHEQRDGGALDLAGRVASEAVVRTLVDDLVGRAVGLTEAAEARELEDVGRRRGGALREG